MRVEVKGGGEDQLEFHLCAFQFLFKSSAEYIHSHTEREEKRERGGGELSTIIRTDRMCASVR